MLNIYTKLQADPELLKNYLWRLAQTVGKQGTAAVILLMSAKYLAPKDFGLLSYYLAAFSLLALFCNFGFSTATARYVAEYKNDSIKTNEVVSSSILLVVVVLSIILTGLFSVAAILNFDTSILLLFLPYIIFVPISNIVDGYFRGSKKFKHISQATLVGGILTLPLSFELIRRFSFLGAALSQSLLFVFPILLLTPSLLKTIKFGINTVVLKKVVNYSLILGMVNLAFFMYSRVDILILKHFGYLIEIGQYELITRFFQIILLPSVLLGQVVAPDISILGSKSQWSKVLSKLKFYFISLFLLGVLISLAIVLFGAPIMKALLPNYYSSGFIQISLILIALFPFKFWGVFLSNGLITASGFARISMITTFIGGFANIILDLLAIKFLGFIGVFIVTLLVHSITIIASTVWFKVSLDKLVQK